jgi:hypothetical protein
MDRYSANAYRQHTGHAVRDADDALLRPGVRFLQMLRTRVFIGLFAVSLAASACGHAGQGNPRPYDGPSPNRSRDLNLLVKNQNFYDATLYAIGPGGSRQRLGRITGNSEDTFTFRWSSLELRIEIDLLSVGSTVTDALPVDEGDDLELIITPDLHRRIP